MKLELLVLSKLIKSDNFLRFTSKTFSTKYFMSNSYAKIQLSFGINATLCSFHVYLVVNDGVDLGENVHVAIYGTKGR